MDELTPQQQTICAALAGGASPKTIAERLELRPNTVRVYIRQLCQMVGAENRSGLIRWVSAPPSVRGAIKITDAEGVVREVFPREVLSVAKQCIIYASPEAVAALIHAMKARPTVEIQDLVLLWSGEIILSRSAASL